jgi:hypothetical protein
MSADADGRTIAESAPQLGAVSVRLGSIDVAERAPTRLVELHRARDRVPEEDGGFATRLDDNAEVARRVPWRHHHLDPWSNDRVLGEQAEGGTLRKLTEPSFDVRRQVTRPPA